MTIKREGLESYVDVGGILRVRRGMIAVIPVPDPTETKSGIIIPEEARQRTDHGVVKYVGDEVEEVEVGDHVLFGGYDGTKVTISGEGVLLIMPEWCVHAILPDEHTRLFTEAQVLEVLHDCLTSNFLTCKEYVERVKASLERYDFLKGFEF